MDQRLLMRKNEAAEADRVAAGTKQKASGNNSPQAKILLTVFDAIEMHGFHLVHASVDEQLLLQLP
jgi:hypothetical protein